MLWQDAIFCVFGDCLRDKNKEFETQCWPLKINWLLANGSSFVMPSLCMIHMKVIWINNLQASRFPDTWWIDVKALLVTGGGPASYLDIRWKFLQVFINLYIELLIFHSDYRRSLESIQPGILDKTFNHPKDLRENCYFFYRHKSD